MVFPKWLLLCSALLFSTALYGQEHEAQEHGEYRNLLGVFVGATRLPGEHGVTFGVEYERHVAGKFGLGVTAETVGGNINENVVVGLGYYHPIEELALFAGGGWDRRLHAEESVHGSDAEESSSEELRGRRALARIGTAYEIPLSRRTVLNPNVAVDFAGGEVILVYGVTFGFRF